jgi:hypothetical protein
VYRPAYPLSFWQRIFTYHALGSNIWEISHDVGAAAGIASEALATRFKHVIVSDPNEGYVNIASARLRQLGFPDSTFTFL